MKNYWINKKTFIITGATSGIGKRLAIKLINENGCKIIGIGRNEKKFQLLKEELGENFEMLIPFAADVTDKQSWENIKNFLTENKISLDGIINCAGMLPPFRKAINITTEDVEEVLKTNFLSCVYAINSLYPTISNSSCPTIINISSAAALATIVGTSTYSASKSAIKSYTEALIYELKGKAYVSLVMPGFARTDIFRSQNSSIDDNRLFLMMSMPAEKMTNKIYRGILKKKTRMIFGRDAHIMNFFYKLCPKTTMKLISKVLKSAKVKLFEEVFSD